MYIDKFEFFPVKARTNARGGIYWFLLKLTTDTGIDGWGEIIWNPYNPRTLSMMATDFANSYIIGKNPFDIEKIFGKAFSVHCKSHSSLSCSGIISGFEIACWDIIGKATGQPIYNLLGGKMNDRIRTYTYLYDPEDKIFCEDFWTMPERCARRAKEYVDLGFTAIKLDPMAPYLNQYTTHYPSLDSINKAEKTISMIREAVGENIDIIIGTHGQFTAAGAISVARALEKYKPLWFEEPTPPGNPGTLKKVSEATVIPICTGERLASKYDYAEYLLDRSVDIYQIDIAGVGGMLEAKKIAAMCEAFHTLITTHFWAGPVNFASQIQLAVCSPNFLIQEAIETMGDFGGFNKILDTPFQWENGDIIPSRKPGLGLDINEEKVRQYVVDDYTDTNILI